MESDANSEYYHRQADHETRLELPSCYADPESVDAWRHQRALGMIRPILERYPDASWMTVGDGRYGSDAFLLSRYVQDVTATSLTDQALQYAFRQGYIRKFRIENAERLSADDDSIDYLLCKETLHHCRRPPVAVYELLRAARKGVVLIEPIEEEPRLLDRLKQAAKKIVRGDAEPRFERSGNFIYRISIREIAKMCTALGGTCFAYRKFNDLYHPKLAHARARGVSAGMRLTRVGIWIQDLLCNLGLLQYGLATIVMFKSPPESGVVRDLRQRRFRIVDLPVNPYAQAQPASR